MKVSIVGTGYVGLVTGVCLAEKGHQVVCVDVHAAKVEQINRAMLSQDEFPAWVQTQARRSHIACKASASESI